MDEEQIERKILDADPPDEDQHPKDNLINQVENFYQTRIDKIMVHRAQMICVDASTKLSEVIKLIQQSGYSRVPVREDGKEGVLGILFAKDLFNYLSILDQKTAAEAMHSPLFVSYSAPIHQLLAHFQRQKVHLAIVVDEYGGVGGLVTLEDVIEELIGEVHDEHDQAVPTYEERDGFLLMDALYPIEDFNKKYDTDLHQEGIGTIGGYICASLDRIPAVKEQLEMQGFRFKVIESKGNRLSKIQVEQIEEPET